MSEYIKKLRVIDANGNPQDKQIDYEGLANKPDLVGKFEKYDNGEGVIIYKGEKFNYDGNVAMGECSHAEGYKTEADGTASHAGGRQTLAYADYSLAHGLGVRAQSQASTAFGKYNDYIAEGDKHAFTIGNGEDDDHRSNALTVDWDGNLNIQNNIYTNIGSIQDELNPQILDYHRVLNYNDLLNIFKNLIYIGDNEPTHTSDIDGIQCYPLLWIDTTPETGGLKYFNNEWKHVPVAYTE